MMLWQPFHLRECMTHMLPDHETERQRSVNNVWSCILGNPGFARINELITELLTGFIAKNTTYNRKNTDSKIINITDCKTYKKRLLAVEYLILMIYYYPTAKTRTLYKSTDGPAGRPTDNLRNSDGLGDFHQTVSESTVQAYWQPGAPSCQRFGSNLDPDPNWWSGTIANITTSTSEQHTSRHLWTLRASTAPCEVYLTTSICSCTYLSSVYSKSMWCAFCFSIRT